MNNRTDWIRASDGSVRPFGCFCVHCGAFQRLATPVQVDVYLAAVRAFANLHEECVTERPGAAERLERESAGARVG